MPSESISDAPQTLRSSHSIGSFIIIALSLSLYWSGAQFYLFGNGFLQAIAASVDDAAVYVMFIGAICGALLAALILFLIGQHPGWSRMRTANGPLGCMSIAIGTVFELLCNAQVHPFTSVPLIAVGPLFITMGILLLLVVYINLVLHHRLVWIIAQALVACILGQIALLILNNTTVTTLFIVYGMLMVIGGLWAHFLLRRKQLHTVNESEHTDVNIQEISSASAPAVDSSAGIFQFFRHHLNILFSAVMVCMMLAFFTLGNSWQSSIRGDGFFSSLPLTIVCCGVGLIAVCWWGHGRPDHIISFIAFKMTLPVLICIAIIMQIIPLEFTAVDLYRAVMRVVFILGEPLIFSLLVYTLCQSGQADGRIMTCLIMLCSVSELIGLATSLLQFEQRAICLGVITALVLIYEVILFSREIVEFNRPIDIDPIHFSSGDDLDARCDEIAKQYGLTEREREVLRELAHGHSSGYIASAFCISTNTARSHMKNIYHKFGISSREELLEFILATGEDTHR